MGRYYRELSADHIRFIGEQRMFFVATAPTGDGRVNLSPKGYESLAVIDAQHIVYLDYPGSGNETANHVMENRRITFMWCSFDAKPLILRTYGAGEVLAKETARFDQMMARHFPRIDIAVTRQLIVQTIEAVQTSCGFGVPRYQYLGEREQLGKWAQGEAQKGTLDRYIQENASRSDQKYPMNR